MLGVLLTILKIIGIILLAILGIIILLICIILFVPICYKVDVSADKKDNKIDVAGKVSWLFNLFRLKFRFNNQSMEYECKVLFFSILSSNNKTKEKNELSTESESNKNEYEENDKAISESTKSEPVHEINKATSQSNKQEAPKKSEVLKSINQTGGNDKKENEKTLSDKIKYTLHNICDKIKKLKSIIDKALDFINNKSHRSALRVLRIKGFKLLKRLKPTQIDVDGYIGFEDPGTTGYLTAIYSAISPWIMKHIRLHPSFNDEHLYGNGKIKGKIFFIHFIIFGISLILNADIRKTFIDINNYNN
ncbi:MAG: DUF2953 domain-containing protein [Suipraeoptans sp.]